MLDFTTQKQLIEPILKNPNNKHCADCDSVSPTWASLDFGVFLCSNCSGAHRGLGPTITRVRSANLDKWQQQWLQNMRIGNTQLNHYWQGDARAVEKKPNGGSSLQEIGRYVFQKYIKRKWVANRDQPDPLTLYKNGQYEISNHHNKKQAQVKEVVTRPVVKVKEAVVVKEVPIVAKKADICLIDFDFDPAPVQNNSNGYAQSYEHHVAPAPVVHHAEEEFTEYTQAGSAVQEKNGNLISFDSLMNQQQQPQVHPQPIAHSYNTYQGIKAHNMQLHHPYNSHLGHHNMVYQGQYQPQPHQMAHQRGFTSMPHSYHQSTVGHPQYGPVPVIPQGSYW